MSDKKTKRYGKTFLVVDLTGTDGEIQIQRMTAEQVQEYAKARDAGDFAVIEGQVVKGFDRKLDPGRLR